MSKNILKEINLSRVLNCFLAITGTHLTKKYGLTVSEIRKDKYKVHSKLHLKFSLNENKNLRENSH